MKITSRATHAFVELKVDETECTIFRSSEKEIDETVSNLLSVIEDLLDGQDKTIHDYLNQ